MVFLFLFLFCVVLFYALFFHDAVPWAQECLPPHPRLSLTTSLTIMLLTIFENHPKVFIWLYTLIFMLLKL